MPVPQPVRARGRTDEPWERGLYLLLLVVAIVVILYSLFGIASLLGFLPLSHGAGGSKQVHHPAVEARSTSDRIKDRPSGKADTAPCPGRAGVKLTALPAPGSTSYSGPAQPPCAEAELDRVAARNPLGTAPSNGGGTRVDGTPR